MGSTRGLASLAPAFRGDCVTLSPAAAWEVATVARVADAGSLSGCPKREIVSRNEDGELSPIFVIWVDRACSRTVLWCSKRPPTTTKATNTAKLPTGDLRKARSFMPTVGRPIWRHARRVGR